MSGIYIHFPKLPHYAESFKCEAPRDLLIEALANTMVSLNGFTTEKMISVAGKEGTYKGTMTLQIGVGHGPRIIYFKSNRALRNSIIKALKILRQPMIDFGIRALYRYYNGTKWQAVRSDEYVMRIELGRGVITFKVKLVKGLGRLDPSELVAMLLERLKANLKELGVERPEFVSLAGEQAPEASSQ